MGERKLPQPTPNWGNAFRSPTRRGANLGHLPAHKGKRPKTKEMKCGISLFVFHLKLINGEIYSTDSGDNLRMIISGINPDF